MTVEDEPVSILNMKFKAWGLNMSVLVFFTHWILDSSEDYALPSVCGALAFYADVHVCIYIMYTGPDAYAYKLISGGHFWVSSSARL